MGEFYVRYEYWVAATQLVLAMLGMGATLTGRDFRDVVLAPRAVSLGTLIQIVFVPLAAFLFLRAVNVPPGVAVGIAVIAAVPGGTVSNIFTFFARGSVALSITITAVTTLVCLLSTPLVLSLLVSDTLLSDFEMPKAKIFTEIAFTLLLPLALGMLYLYLYPRSAPVLSKWSIRGSLLGILLIVVGSSLAGRLDPAKFGYENILIVLLFVIVLSIAAFLFPRLMRLSKQDAAAIEFEVIVRNVNLGVLLKASIFPAANPGTAALGDMVLLTLLLYGALQLLASGGLIAWYRSRPPLPLKR